jgi:hypothetical protein
MRLHDDVARMSAATSGADLATRRVGEVDPGYRYAHPGYDIVP